MLPSRVISFDDLYENPNVELCFVALAQRRLLQLSNSVPRDDEWIEENGVGFSFKNNKFRVATKVTSSFPWLYFTPPWTKPKLHLDLISYASSTGYKGEIKVWLQHMTCAKLK